MDKIVNSISQVDMSDLKMPIVAAYKSPRDYPGKFVGRVFDMDKPTNTIIISDDIRMIHGDIIMHTHMRWFPRSPHDDMCVLGVWM